MSVLVPRPGQAPARTAPRGDERVLHLALRNSRYSGAGLATALGRLGQVKDLDWRRYPPERLRQEIVRAAEELRPTVVFMQLGRGGTAVTPEFVRDVLRPKLDPTGVILNWDFDQFFEPHEEGRRWFVELGRECDASLVVNTAHPYVYAAMGVRCPGFFAPGVDPGVWHPAVPHDDDCQVAFLGSHYPKLPRIYARRAPFIARVAAAYGRRLRAYGQGWEHLPGVRGCPTLRDYDEARVYARAAASIACSSRNDLPRYTSDRLFRMLASGAVCVVERFADCAGYGLVHGVNCLLWTGEEELLACLAQAVAWDGLPESHRLRAGARSLGCEHSWDARMDELQALTDVARHERTA